MKSILITVAALCGIHNLIAQTWTLYDDSNSGLDSDDYSAIAIDDNGNVWVGGFYSGLSVFDGSTWTTYKEFNSDLIHDDVQDIVVDAANRVWAGTYQGISMLDGSTFTTYDSSNTNMPGETAYKLGLNTNDDVWVATKNGSFGYQGITVYSGLTWTNLTGYPSQMEDKEYTDFVFTQANNAWMGCNGIAYYDGSFTYYPFAATGMWLADAVTFDAAGNLWAVGLDGFLKRSGSTWTFTSSSSLGLPSPIFYELLADGNYLWAGSTDGLIKFNRIASSVATIYTSSNSILPDNGVYDLAKGSDGSLWFATSIGVVRLQEGVGLDVPTMPEVIISPNPVVDELTIKLSYPVDGFIEVVDMAGRQVLTKGVSGETNILRLSHLPSGVYCVTLMCESGATVRQLISLR